MVRKDSVYVSKRVEIKINKKALLIVSGERKTSYPLIEKVGFDKSKNRLYYKRVMSKKKKEKKRLGLLKVLLNQGFLGSQLGYSSTMEVIGIGYSFSVEEKTLVMRLGYTHTIKVEIPKEIRLTIINQKKLVLEGVSNQKISNFGAFLQSFKYPNVYKEKGIYISNQVKKVLKPGKRS